MAFRSRRKLHLNVCARTKLTSPTLFRIITAVSLQWILLVVDFTHILVKTYVKFNRGEINAKIIQYLSIYTHLCSVCFLLQQRPQLLFKNS